ncbi:MAG: GNAT family N-acetyltransferase [Shimia sp.]
MRVAPAQDSDLPGVLEIWNAAIRGTAQTFTTKEKTLDGLRALLHPPHVLLVARAEGVLGFGTLGPFRGGPGYRHSVEHTLYVAQTARGRGIGVALLRGLEDAARAQAAHVMVGAISGENPRSVAFHLREGFTEVGRMLQVGRKFDRWMDLVLVQKVLS